jgi:hypothetical protein
MARVLLLCHTKGDIFASRAQLQELFVDGDFQDPQLESLGAETLLCGFRKF